MIKTVYSLLLIILIPLLQNAAYSQPEITPALSEILSEKTDDEFISVNIRLEAQYEQENLYQQTRMLPNREERRQLVINELKTFSMQSQAELLSFLESEQQKGNVKEITPLWIGNLINAKIKPAVATQLSSRKDLARLDYNQERMVLLNNEHKDSSPAMMPDKLTNPNIAWNVSHINAHQVWEMNFTGEGIVVAVLDSGVNYNHQDLQPRMWTHPDYPNHGYNFVNNNHNTMDYNGHGTHCAGTVAGSGAAGTATGMAPGASIMALKALGDSGGGTEAGVWQAIEFAVEYGAHVMSLSLGWKHAWNPDRSMWRTTMNNALNAGVIAAVASGNEGNSWSDTPPNEVRTPGDVPPPWLHPDQTLTGGISAVLSVGSTTSTDNLSGFSSKGPVTWQNVSPFNDYPHPGMGLIRPDVVAPGSDILSLTHNHNGSYTVKSGTSMATPAVAGVIALMLSKNPELTPEEISKILEESAVPLSESKSNQFGSGRIDALEAVMETPFAGIVWIDYHIDDSQGNNDGKINPGENINLDISFINPDEIDAENVFASISTSSPYITFADTLANLGTIPAGETILFEELFPFTVSDSIPGNHAITFSLKTWLQEDEEQSWISAFTVVAHAPDLKIKSYMVLDAIHGNNNGILDPGETATLRFIIENNGQLASDELVMKLEAVHPFILLDNPQIQLQPVAAEGQRHADFEVTVNERINPGIVTQFDQIILSGAYIIRHAITEKIGIIGEDWHTGDFDQFDWTQQGNADWVIDAEQSVYGSWSARSGNITHNQQTELQLEYDVFATDSISFYRKVSSENNYDWLEFYIDDVRKGRWSGDRNWERFVFPVEAGERTFRWVYVKDGSVSAGQDAAWIDFIELPSKTQTTAFAGFDSETCSNTPIELTGYALRFDDLQWGTPGDGTFEMISQLKGWYYPGPEDISNGFVNIKLTAQYAEESPVTDEMEIIFLPTPLVDLGGDTLVCENHTLELDAGEGNYTYEWFDGSSGRFFLFDPTAYTESEVEVWVRATHENGCFDTDSIRILIDPCTFIAEESDLELVIYPNPAGNTVHIAFMQPVTSPSIIQLVSITGQLMKTRIIAESSNPSEISLDLTNFRKGVYFLRMESPAGSFVRKLIVQ